MRLPLPRRAGRYLLLLPLALLIGAWSGPAWLAAAELDSLVPPNEEISAFEARLFLARLLASEEGGLEEAAELYRHLVRDSGQEVTARRELTAVLLRLGRPREAKEHLEAAFKLAPADPELRQAMAGAETALGHLRQAREMVAGLCGSTESTGNSLSCASLRLSWGDFYQAETLARRYLAAHPEEPDGRLMLASILAGSQRLAEAEGVIRLLLLDFPGMTELYARLATIKILDKDFAAALAVIAQAPEEIASTPALLLAAGQANLEAHRDHEALELFARAASTQSPLRERALLGRARAYRHLGQEEEIGPLLAGLLGRDPEQVEARYLTAGGKLLSSAEFLESLSQAANSTPDSLSQWARLYAEDGLTSQALACYDAALARDRDYFPARLERAQLLAGGGEYGPALAELAALARELPANAKVLLARARVLGWSKHYEESISAYEEMSALNPADPIPRVEAARTAMWGKNIAAAGRYYSGLWSAPVDGELTHALSGGQAPAAWLAEVQEHDDSTSPWDAYEQFAQGLEASPGGPTTPEQEARERIRLTLLPAYRLQKSAFLEKKAKELLWENRLARAMASYAELVAFQPGNQESWFDYAQSQCALGLCDAAGKSYEELLAIAPLHNLAGLALARQRLQSHPGLTFHSSFWEEKGRGDLADLARRQSDLTLELPLHCRFRLEVIARRWEEEPGGAGESLAANGFGVRLAGAANPYLRGAIELHQKRYETSGLPGLDSGAGELWFNFQDTLRLGLGLERRDELANRFAFTQGIQGDHRWLAVLAPLSRQLELGGRAEALSYSDGKNGNKGWLSALSLAYALSDHPRQFKIKLRGEARDTRSPSVSLYQNGELVDIRHPYWTPQDYRAGGLELEWRHDLARRQFCGAKQHTYDIKLGWTADSENNPALRGEAEYLYEFSEHWQLQLRGIIHYSGDWKAAGSSGGIQYRF